MRVLLIVDMQQGMLNGEPKHDLEGVVSRINRLADAIRRSHGRVVFVRHEGPASDPFEPGAPGWEFLPGLEQLPEDTVVAKSLNDAFFETSLRDELDSNPPPDVYITGWAADLCVDSTVRSAAALGYRVTAISDAITVSDRPGLPAPRVIAHHLWLWSELICEHRVRIATTQDVVAPGDAP